MEDSWKHYQIGARDREQIAPTKKVEINVITEKGRRERRETRARGEESNERGKNILWIREWLRISRSVPPGGDFLRLCSPRYISSPFASLNRTLRCTCRKYIPRTECKDFPCTPLRYRRCNFIERRNLNFGASWLSGSSVTCRLTCEDIV